AGVASVDDVRAAVQTAAGSPLTLGIERDGSASSVSVTPRLTDVNGQQQWLLGVGLTLSFDLPVDVKIQINNVGGP
ncbi:hypothetical protein ABTK20_23305, partial [Acinetobacter baumannii]